MLNFFINDITTNCTNYLPVAIITGIIFIAFYWRAHIYDHQGKPTRIQSIDKNILSQLILVYIFFIYCFMIVAITFISREPGSRDAIRLQIFRIFTNDVMERTYAIENIIMFVPLGFMLPLIWRRYDSLRRIPIAGLLCSTLIEVIQHITKRGYSELDDILNNAIGSIVGYLVLIVVRYIVRQCETLIRKQNNNTAKGDEQ